MLTPGDVIYEIGCTWSNGIAVGSPQLAIAWKDGVHVDVMRWVVWESGVEKKLANQPYTNELVERARALLATQVLEGIKTETIYLNPESGQIELREGTPKNWPTLEVNPVEPKRTWDDE